MQENFRGWLALVLIVIAIIMIAAGLLYSADFISAGFPQRENTFVSLIHSWGNWGVAGSIGLMILHSVVPFPAEALAMANGIVYGLFWGSVITWTGAMLGAFFAFGCTRLLGQRFAKKMLSEKNWQTVENWSAQYGWQTLLLVRFIPVIAFNVINYAAGLTTVSVWTFTWTTALGILPLTILSAWLGDRLTGQPLWLGALLLLLIFGCCLGLRAMWLKLRKQGKALEGQQL